MKITLNDQEIREALIKAVNEKTSCIMGVAEDNNCWFTATDTNGEEIDDLGFIEFHCEF
jgi:hypothetical protein